MRNKLILILLACTTFTSCTRNSGPSSTSKYTSQGVDKDIKGEVSAPKKSKAAIDYYVTVVNVVDGDTFDAVTQDRIEIRFRLHGIDAPERKQDFSAKSKDKLSELIFGKKVGIKVYNKRDGYGRPVVYVITDECADVGAEMLRTGLAWHSKKYDDSELYDELEIEARKKKRGLWSVNNPIPPWEYRK